MEKRYPKRNDNDMEIIAGFFKGIIADSFFKISTQTVGLRIMSSTALIDPDRIEAIAPLVEKFFQIIDKKSEGKFPLAAIEKASPTKKATF
jgi:hypothetical protein